MSFASTIRVAAGDDHPFLNDMLWEAAAVSSFMCEIGKAAALAMPTVSKYLNDWGRSGDGGVFAVNDDGEPLGAAWYRIFPVDAPGYGFVAADIPELSIGVSESARGRGVGGALISESLAMAKEEGYPGVSLSVDRENPAVALYERHGFRDAGISGPEETSVTMVTKFL